MTKKRLVNRAADPSIEFSCILEMRETHIRKRRGVFRPPSPLPYMRNKTGSPRCKQTHCKTQDTPNDVQGLSLTAALIAIYHHARQHSRIRTGAVSWKMPETRVSYIASRPSKSAILRNSQSICGNRKQPRICGNTVTCCFLSGVLSRCGNCISFMRGATFMDISPVWWLESAV